MFKFNFTGSELGTEDCPSGAEPTIASTSAHPKCDDSYGTASGLSSKTENGTSNEQLQDMAVSAMRELSMQELARHLPHVISYSPLVVPLTGEPDRDVLFDRTNTKESASARRHSEAESVEATVHIIEREQSRSVTLVRRDLFDIRYQLMAQDGIDSNVGESAKGGGIGERDANAAALPSYIDNPSDLVAGVYEGGLKTWECSLDLVDCLSSLEDAAATSSNSSCRNPWAQGKNIIEIGCGTAIPTLYILQLLFSQSASCEGEELPQTRITLQDYNDSVIRLVTFPNVLLTWYISSQAESYRSTQSDDVDEDESAQASSSGGNMHITPTLLSAFKSSLEQLRVSLRFLVGPWQAMVDNLHLLEAPYDLVLSSETIYQIPSLPSLVRLLQLSVTNASENDIRNCVGDLTLDDADDRKKQIASGQETTIPLCLVAAKVLYFGVGGGINDFERAVKARKGNTRSVLQRKTGVGRMVLRVDWT